MRWLKVDQPNWPSLWVIISAPWYKLHGAADAPMTALAKPGRFEGVIEKVCSYPESRQLQANVRLSLDHVRFTPNTKRAGRAL